MEEYIKLRNSALNLANVRIPKQKSSIVLTAFPGRNADNSFSLESMFMTFDYLQKENCLHLLSLVEEHEFDEYCSKKLLETEAYKRSIIWHHFPVADMDVPKKNVLERISSLRTDLTEVITSGNSVAIHCKGGLGRSGTIAAIILIDLGLSVESAIDNVRKFRPGAIETREQELFISCIKPASVR